MAQKTNLNISPYYDDFSADKDFYKILFNPGRPVQARELTSIQSLLQNQIETFGNHLFKEGSVVIPGNLTYDGQFYAVKLNQTNSGIDITLYLKNLIGKKVVGQTSGVTARVQRVEFPNGTTVLTPTIYVKYLDSDDNFNFTQFSNSEFLTVNDNITYGGTTISSGTPVASCISFDATSTGSAVFIGDGIYFVRGFFVKVASQSLVLDYYDNNPSYRVGLTIEENIITSKDDTSLYDNARGFENYAAPGSDRLQITLTLDKKLLSDLDDSNFIELLRLDAGKIKKIENKSTNDKFRDYLAQRTYEESGDYAVTPFNPSIHNSLNNRLGNNGLFFDSETTPSGSTPSDDLMCLKVSPGKAYVRGYDIEKQSTTILDVEKPRDTTSETNVGISFEMGNLIRVNNVSGSAIPKSVVTLYGDLGQQGIGIGSARVYAFNLTDSQYQDDTTLWDLYLYDIQTNTRLTLNKEATNTEIPASSYIKGKNSGATAYTVVGAGGTNYIDVRETSGTFIVGEAIEVNGIDFPRTIVSARVYNTQSIKSFKQDTFATTGIATFTADASLERFRFVGGITQVSISAAVGGISTVTAPGRFFSVREGTTVRYQKPGFTEETYNKITSVAADGASFQISAISPSVSGVYEGSLPTAALQTDLFPTATIVRNTSDGYLYSTIPHQNVSSVSLSGSSLKISAQLTNQTISNNTITLDANTVASEIGVTDAFFDSFDQERYSVIYKNGAIATLSSDSVEVSNDTLIIRNLVNTDATINVTLVKNGVKNKIKSYIRSEKLEITRSKYRQSGVDSNTSVSDGLDYSPYYGLRVQDEEICLLKPDIVKIMGIFESFDSNLPTLDKLLFTSTDNVSVNAIIGENIIGRESKAVARIVSRLTNPTNTLEIVYLTNDRFVVGEQVDFEESNILSQIEAITLGKYKDITNSYTLDKGQKEQYYDYGKLIRNKESSIPNKKIIVVYDYYTVESNDNGDVFTVLSYDRDRFSTDVPFINSGIRASDTLDFRPRVSTFNPATTNGSPFEFGFRNFGSDPKIVLTPNETFSISYDYYLPRIDRLYLSKIGEFVLEKGVSAINPKAPTKSDAMMEIATIQLPPYLYNPQDAIIQLRDNRRYTMRDIGYLDNRIQNLETVTSLSFLEVQTQTLQVQDSDGRNRFKTGFFVDDFKNNRLINAGLSNIQVNPTAREMIPMITRNSIKSKLISSSEIIDEELDYHANFELLDPNVQKTGNSVTLKYDEVDWIQQLYATGVENVNPFNVVVYTGIIELNPSVDTWVRTIQLPDRNINITNNSSRTITRDLSIDLRQTINNPVVRENNTTSRVRIANPSRRGSTGVVGSTSSTSTSTQSFSASSRSTNVTFDTVTNTDVSIRNVLVSTSDESFMRSRNTEFSVSNLKPSTQYYQFLDNNSSVDFTPKLIEVATDNTLSTYGTTGTFRVGETVVGSVNGVNLMSFRLATPDHKYGPFNAPTTKYTINPYIKTETLLTSYSNSTKVLNIDTASLSEEAQGRYNGYLTKGMLLIGQTSGAIAYVKDLRLISDNYGDLIGTFFLRDPNTIPVPVVRIPTGTKTFKLSSSATNEIGVPGSNAISFAEVGYTADGTLNQWENEVTTVTSNLTTQTVTNLGANLTTNLVTTTRNTNTTVAEFFDPLAQSFTVGGTVEAPGANDSIDDINGAFLTSVGLFFRFKDDGNAPVRVEIRTVDLGTPTRIILGKPVTLRPDQVLISEDGETETKVTFPEPIYLAPGNEYAVVVISAHSDKYEMWIATMGEPSIKTQSLPATESVIYSRQFAMGSLFKSQNGSIWTANQYQDLKFKLYKAEFVENTGTAFFTTPSLNESNGYVSNLNSNPIETLPKTATLGITNTTNSGLVNDILKVGRKISGTSPNTYGYIVGTGSSVSNTVITDGGTNYPASTTITNLETTNIVGKGSGLRLSVTTNSSGSITNSTVTASGTGYQVGDVVGIVTTLGRNSRISVSSITGVDTLYLSGLQGEANSFAVGVGVSYYPDDYPSNPIVSLASTTITSFTPDGGVNSGNYIKVNHFDHGMYSGIDKIQINNVQSSYAPTTLSAAMSVNESNTISIGDTSGFYLFEGSPVGAANTGYVKIGSEIIGYSAVQEGTLTVSTSNGRGVDQTLITLHDKDSLVYKYELNGVSLRRINKDHNIISTDIGIDNYYIEIPRSENGADRSSDGSLSNAPQLSFADDGYFGGPSVTASENINYSSIIPSYELLTPGAETSTNAFIRTVSGTSAGGNEPPFVEQISEPVQLNSINTLGSMRLVASEINEKNQPGLTKLLRNKTFITGITLNTRNKNLSPVIYLDNAITEFRCSRLNLPISNYVTDSRVNAIFDDPHAAVYVSNTVSLAQPASTLKVIFSAYRHSSADFRVLYSLIKADSSEVPQSFELFPGYDNLKFVTEQGNLIVDQSKNTGRPDVYVQPSLDGQFLEYQYTADNLDLFVGYTIKIVMSGTDQSKPPRIKEFRTLAVR